MKKLFCLTLAFLTFALALPAGAVTGQTSESSSVIYPGVTMTHITTKSGTKYGLQDMRIVEFDPKDEGLSLSVATGYSALNSLSTVSNTVSRWSAANPDRAPLVAINGDWFTVGYDDYSSATSKKQLYLPLGFNMHGGEIVCTQQTSKESPHTTERGNAPSFGVTPDGTPLIGCIWTTTTMNFRTKAIAIDGINRLPSDNSLIMYTDKGPSSNYCLDDAYELYVDFSEDYVVRHGMKVVGTVSAVSAPGEARQAIKADRMIITARGSRIGDISSIPVGTKLRFTVSIEDAYGNTDAWRTVTDCVGGHHEFARGGEYFAVGDSTNYPANVIGITAEGKVIFLCNDGRQSGYSVGVAISKMPDLARELGIVSGIYMDGGGSTTLVAREGGAMKLQNRPCNNGNAERSVSNAVILFANRINTPDLTFDASAYSLLLGSTHNETLSLTDGGLAVIATDPFDPFGSLDLSGVSADEYKYIAFDIKTNYKDPRDQLIGLYLAAGATPGATEGCKASFTLPATGESVRLYVDLTSLSLWTGDVHSVRIDLFDNATGGEAGRGVIIREMKFCKTKAEAEEFCDPVLIGDVNGDGKINLNDLADIKKYLAGADGVFNVPACDVNGDAAHNIEDLSAMKKLLA